MLLDGTKTKAADQTAAKVGENVAVEVLHYHHIKLVRVHDELHAGVVDDLVISLDFRVILCNFTEDREEHAVRHLEDVCLVNAGNFLSTVLLRVLEGVADDALRCFLGNDLDRVNRVLIDLFFFPTYRPSVFSRKITISTFLNGVFTASLDFTGRIFA